MADYVRIAIHDWKLESVDLDVSGPALSREDEPHKSWRLRLRFRSPDGRSTTTVGYIIPADESPTLIATRLEEWAHSIKKSARDGLGRRFVSHVADDFYTGEGG